MLLPAIFSGFLMPGEATQPPGATRGTLPRRYRSVGFLPSGRGVEQLFTWKQALCFLKTEPQRWPDPFAPGTGTGVDITPTVPRADPLKQREHSGSQVPESTHSGHRQPGPTRPHRGSRERSEATVGESAISCQHASL